jgi:hypothetical protein
VGESMGVGAVGALGVLGALEALGALGTVFTTLYFLCNLQIGRQASVCPREVFLA